jgi:hypothetical protein
MQFSGHPRRIQAFRDAKPACAGIPNYRCKACKQTIYAFKGRKRVPDGWICPGCAS